MKRILSLSFLLVFGIGFNASAYAQADKDYPDLWSKPGGDAPDKEVPGFLVNLGPTGARAIVTKHSLIVRHIFKDSPAVGKLKLGDEIVGAFGKPFDPNAVPTQRYGYEGPIMEFGRAIEKAEGKDGTLVLNVKRESKVEDVTIALEAIGSFSPTFPVNCKKSALLRARALKYFVDHPEADGACNTRSAICLALLASDDPKHQANAKQRILQWATERPDAGTWTWPAAYQLITLGEYYLMTKDASVLPAMKLASNHLEQIQYKHPIDFGHKRTPDNKLVVNGVTFDYDKLKAAIDYYDGGFGHGSPGGYGPMQYTTILAVIGWQLAERSGVAVTPARMASAFKYIHYGTNASGALAYGSEFTFGGYAIEDPLAFGRQTGGERAVGKSGAALIAHKLASERADSTEYVNKYKGYYKNAHAGLPNGHADGNLNLFWGFVGAGAADDDATLRTVFDYFKPWINMARCWDGSFVTQPNRHSGDDDAYYHSSRYNATASMALAFGIASPKLFIQGIQVSIPGVNPKVLQGSLAAAYKAIIAKAYGEAAKILKSAGPEGASMSTYLDGQAHKMMDALGLLGKAGRWVELQQRLQEVRKSHGGIPAFDEGAASWDAALKGKAGSAILAADKQSTEGFHGKALAALQPAFGTEHEPVAKAVEERILSAARWTVANWDAMEKAGEWHRLRKDLDSNKERYRGVAIVDERVTTLEASMSSGSGKSLVEADRLLSEGAAGPSLAALGALDTAPAKALRARVDEAVQRVLTSLEAFEKEGRWLSLKDGLTKSRSKMAGLAAFDARAKAWEAALSTPSGREWIASEKAFQQGDLGVAAKNAPPSLMKHIDETVREQLKPLQDLETKGDWYALERSLPALRKKLSGVAAFDERDAGWKAAFKAEPAKTALQHGAVLARLRAAAGHKATPALLKEIEAFAAQAGDTFYGRQAKELLKGLSN